MNHAYVMTRKWVRAGPIDVLLRKLVALKWGDALRVKMDGEELWRIDDNADVPRVGVQVWIESRRKLEMRKYYGGGLSDWLQTYLQENLAKELGGRCGNFGCADRWDPDPDKFATFEKWWRYFNASPHHREIFTDEVIEHNWERLKARYPNSLLGE